jgi:hypothetical protein
LWACGGIAMLALLMGYFTGYWLGSIQGCKK